MDARGTRTDGPMPALDTTRTETLHEVLDALEGEREYWHAQGSNEEAAVAHACYRTVRQMLPEGDPRRDERGAVE